MAEDSNFAKSLLIRIFGFYKENLDSLLKGKLLNYEHLDYTMNYNYWIGQLLGELSKNIKKFHSEIIDYTEKKGALLIKMLLSSKFPINP